jgi:hypothetical protein
VLVEIGRIRFENFNPQVWKTFFWLQVLDCLFLFFSFQSPSNMGLLDPSTSDGRVIFFLPWQKVTLAGWYLVSQFKLFLI